MPRCPHCCKLLSEVGFTFPPAALIIPALGKAIADKGRLLLLEYLARPSALWESRLAASDWGKIHVALRDAVLQANTPSGARCSTLRATGDLDAAAVHQ
jgi:hypothetical protein